MTGAERAEARPDRSFLGAVEPETATAEVERHEAAAAEAEAAPETRRRAVPVLGTLLSLLALAWIGAFAWSLYRTRPEPTLEAVIGAVTTLSMPLVLLGLLWLMFGRTSRRETERFTRAVTSMRDESRALESVLEIVAARLEQNHARLRGEAERLMTLGDEASDRLGRVTHYLSKESGALDRHSTALEAAAAAAKVDIGVLLLDLPRAEEQARAVAAAMKEAGLEAHGRAGALEAQLAAVTAKSREAGETVGGAAERLAAHLARIESSGTSAAASMEQASAGMNAAVDGAMARVGEALDLSRTSLDAQGTAMLAAIEQSRAALENAGAEASRALGERLDEVAGRLEGLAGQLAAQEASAHALVTGLGKELAELDQWFAQLGRSGGAEAERLGTTVAAVREAVEALGADLTGGRERAAELAGRARELAGAVDAVTERLEGPLPAALAEVEAQAGRAAAAAEALAPAVEKVERCATSVERKIDAVSGSAERIGGLIAAHDDASRNLVARLFTELAELEERFAHADRDGAERAAKLSGAIAQVRAAAAELGTELGGGDAQAEALGARAGEMREALAALTTQLRDELPPALSSVEKQAAELRGTAAAIAPLVDGAGASAGRLAESLAGSESALAAQQQAVDALLSRIEAGAAEAADRLRGIATAASEADDAAAKIVHTTSAELIDALLRVRETAATAAERAREAIGAIVPASAAALGEASREALVQAVGATVQEQMGVLNALAQRSLDAAREASERLTRQMLALGESSAAIENRIDSARREREEAERESFSRRVALLIESLNSTSIDVTKILSNEVTDSAWAAYLKGDRGVFTRRAVRLLDTTETREIVRHYEEEPEFREQVNRYIHDFEAMLRRVLAEREGSPLSITLLSSDMGKLYVALAQAIERLRK